MGRFTTFQDEGGKWRWRLYADNNKKIATSGEWFASRANARRAAQRVSAVAPFATLPVSLTPAGRRVLARRVMAGAAPPSTGLRALSRIR